MYGGLFLISASGFTSLHIHPLYFRLYYQYSPNIFCTRQWKGLDRKSTDDGHEDGKEALRERKRRTRSRVGGAIEVGGRLN